MLLGNFTLLERINSPGSFGCRVSVDVTTGMLWWKKTSHKEIRRELGGFWFFVETGKFTPDHQAEELERAWRAKNETRPIR